MKNLVCILVVLMCAAAQAHSRAELIEATWKAVCQQESANDPNAVGDDGKAVGIAQIHRIYMDDANRILALHGCDERFRDADRKTPYRCRQMFVLVTQHYAPKGGPEQWARIHNGGPDGHKQDCTLEYWAKVRRHLSL